METEEQDFTITIDGTKYKFSELESDNQSLVRHIRDLEVQLEQVNFKYEQVHASKLFFSDKLVQNLKQTPKTESPAESTQDSKE